MKKQKQTFFSKKKLEERRRISNIDEHPHNHKEEHYAKVNGGVFVYSKPLSVAELSKAINVPAPAIIKFLFLQGKAVTINQMLDDEMIGTICLQFNYDFKKEKIVDAEHFEEIEIKDDPKDLVERAPVVTVMGHVDHGKTSIIDAIRHSEVAAHEAGGISQAIGAYQKDVHGKKITIIDTPGHAAFAAMRARGASVTDIVVLVVAADDGVMPQTVEAIDHAKAANCQIIVAINKMDKAGANPAHVKEQLMQHDVIAEDYGGDVMCVPCSAKTGMGINDLLETILTKAETMELKANPNRYAIGTVLESNLDKGEGPKATLLVQNGTLNASDYVVVGSIYGKIRRMSNEYGQVVHAAGPSSPVVVTGLSDVPSAGDRFMASAGGGAWLNGQRLNLSSTARLAGGRLAGPQPSSTKVARALEMSVVPKIPSLAVRFAKVAEGAIEGALSSANSHDWDIAAADLILHEAGGLLAGLDGARPRYNKRDLKHGALAAAAATAHPELLAAFARAQ